MQICPYSQLYVSKDLLNCALFWFYSTLQHMINQLIQSLKCPRHQLTTKAQSNIWLIRWRFIFSWIRRQPWWNQFVLKCYHLLEIKWFSSVPLPTCPLYDGADLKDFSYLSPDLSVYATDNVQFLIWILLIPLRKLFHCHLKLSWPLAELFNNSLDHCFSTERVMIPNRNVPIPFFLSQ